ncbi:MAG TPA: hypothetical protein VGC56_07350 [Allosphingosinicella sp.]|jgi:hypothetical protein
MENAPDFLTRNGFTVSRGSRAGLYDVERIGRDLTADQVWDAFFRLYFWPAPWPAQPQEPTASQKLCGG